MSRLEKPLRVLIVTSELAPHAKAGGLADVAAALASHLAQRGHEVRVVLPLYRGIRESGIGFSTELESMCVRMGGTEEWCAVRRLTTNDGVRVLLVEHEAFFNRSGLYHDELMRDYDDNPRRFGFFSRAALQYCMDADFRPDIVHANDWQTALIPAYMKTWFWNHPILGRAASVLTLHNVAYQGVYEGEHYDYLGLGRENFNEWKFESFGRVHFLKGGIHFADVVNTVSPGHAREITTPFGGFGMAPYLAEKGDAFVGILNGVDYSHWNPETDKLLPARYGVDDLSGKAVCKRELQREFQLEERDDLPILGCVGRFVGQKGFHVLAGAIDEIMRHMHLQFVILGSGEWDLSNFYGSLPARWPGRVGSHIGYNERLAHLIEAGADFFLMPSFFEPCGLNQLYSLRYGTLPIVRATGGLDDTVEQYDEKTGEGTGFKYHAHTPRAIYDTVGWAVSTWYDRKDHMRTMIRRAMQKDFSWEHATPEYEKLYDKALKIKAAGETGGI